MKDKEKTVEVLPHLSYLPNSCYSYNKPLVSTLKKHGILKMLQNNQEIVILGLGRGNYIMNHIINDESKFKQLTADPTSLREGQLQRLKKKKLKMKVFLIKMYIKVCILQVLYQPQ